MESDGNGKRRVISSKNDRNIIMKDNTFQIKSFSIENESNQLTTSNKKFLTRTSDTLRIYFHISYSMLFLPIKVEFSSEENKFVSTGNTIQKVCCILLYWMPSWINHFLYLIRRVLSFIRSTNRQPKHYFALIRIIIHIIRSICLYLTIVKSPQHVANIINMTRRKCIQKRPNKVAWRWGFGAVYIGLLMGLLTIFQLSRMFLNLYAYQKKQNVPWLTALLTNWNARMFQPAKNPPTENFSFWNIFTGILEFWLQIGNTVNYALIETFFFGPITITIWYAVRDFVEMVKTMRESVDNENERQKIQQHIEDEYKELRQLSDAVSQLTANLHLCSLTALCITAIMHLEQSVKNTTYPTGVTQNIIRILCMSISLIFSADAYKKMVTFRVWLEDGITKRRFFKDTEKFYVLLDQVKSECVGLGNVGVYKLDYGFIAQVLVVSITLFVVGFQ